MFDTERNKQIVRRIFEDVWNRADMSAADEIFASPEGVKRYVSYFLSVFPGLRHSVEIVIAEGDWVAAAWTASGTQAGDFHGLPARGNQVTFSGVTVARVVAAKIVQHHTQWDTLGLLEQLGAVPLIRKADGSRL